MRVKRQQDKFIAHARHDIGLEVVARIVAERVMDEADEQHGCAVWFVCSVCLTATWGFVKMITCCRCRSLARLICPERAAVERVPEETAQETEGTKMQSNKLKH